MNEFIEKLIGRSEEKAHQTWLVLAERNGYERAIEIVNELADEYNNGWIPCSERLPENISTVLVQVEEFESPTIGWYGNIAGWRLLEKDFDELNDFTVIAWKPLPQPYQPKGE